MVTPSPDAATALAAGEWATARSAFDEEIGTRESGSRYEGLARACYGQRDYEAAIDAFERSFVAYRREDNGARAAYVAGRWLAFIHGAVSGNAAVAGGWLRRALTLIEEVGSVAERGWVDLAICNMTSDASIAAHAAREALGIADRIDDTELGSCARAHLGGCLVAAGNTTGMALIDEALTACSSGEVSDPVVVGEIYCKLFGSCEVTGDVVRAQQWLSAVDDLAIRRNLTGFSGICRTHYGGLLVSCGRWAEAEEELDAAIRAYESSYRALTAAPIVRLADLRVRQGRTEEAAHLLSGLDRRPDAARPLASIHRARGEDELAKDVLERALCEPDLTAVAEASRTADLVAILVDRGETEAARHAIERLDQRDVGESGDYARAASALARARLCAATGADDARLCYEQAITAFARSCMPLEISEARIELAQLLVRDRPAVAVSEAKQALSAFEELGAARHADGARALLRSLGETTSGGRRGSGPLTKRENEVLDLLGHGLTNQEIADRLVISIRTAEHHVSRVLTKLGFKRRAEAAAYAARAPH